MVFQSQGKSITSACLRRAMAQAVKNRGSRSSLGRTDAAAFDFLRDHIRAQPHSTVAPVQKQSPPNNSDPPAWTSQQHQGSSSASSVSKENDNGTSKGDNNKNTNAGPPPPPPPPPPVDKLLQDVEKAALYNQGNTRNIKSKRRARKNYFWDAEFCRQTAEAYEHYLLALAKNPKSLPESDREKILAPHVVDKALSGLLKSRFKPNKLSDKVRSWERALGTLSATPLTEDLSMRLLEANGKSGNLGRVISLLEFRKSQSYKPTRREFVYAITGVEAAGWYLREHRNIFLGDLDQPVIDNPTRWLDAILMNMRQRNYPLTMELASRMLDTFASRGRTGKAMHYFYSVHRTPVSQKEEEEEEEDDDDLGDNNEYLEDYNDESDTVQEGDNENEEGNNVKAANNKPQPPPYQVRLKLKTPPPYYKVPTDVKGKLLPVPPKKNQSKDGPRRKTDRQRQQGVLKIDRELEPDWSPPLTAAFSFADSLTYGACGHEPIQLNLVCYNILIKACVYRGALWRAMHLLDTVMPSAGITPDNVSFDTLLSGLARVGDVTLMRDYYQRMISRGIKPTYYTVQCIVDGLLNLGDVAGAVTVVQDFFNQHSVLPPVDTQLKIFEFALGLEMPYEAKRHVYFIQQLWKWQPHYKYDSKEFMYHMKTYQRDPRLSKEALQHLFRYFGEELEEEDFF